MDHPTLETWKNALNLRALLYLQSAGIGTALLALKTTITQPLPHTQPKPQTQTHQPITIPKHTLLIITTIGAILRLATLSNESLWYDEAYTAFITALPINDMIQATLNDVHSPLYYLILYPLTTLLGHSEYIIRLPSALAGITLIPLTHRLTTKLNLPQPTPTIAALLIALAPFQIYYSQEARMYTLLMLLTTTATLALIERRWPLLAITAAATMWLHNLGCLYIAALGWLTLYKYPPKTKTWQPYAALTIAALAWLPWIIWGLIPQVQAVTDSFWIQKPHIGTPIQNLTELIFSHRADHYLLIAPPLLIFTIPNIKKHWPLIALTLLPLALAIIISLTIQPILIPRILAPTAIPLTILLATGLTPHKQKWTTWILPAGFIIVFTAWYIQYTIDPLTGRFPWDYGQEKFTQNIQPNDIIYHGSPASYITSSYYIPNTQYVMRRDTDLLAGLSNQTKDHLHIPQIDFDNLKTNNRIWIIHYDNPTTPQTERTEIQRIVTKHQAQPIPNNLNNPLIKAKIYLIPGGTQ